MGAKFVFRNTSRETIKIDKLKSSCGCTTASVDKKSMAPGEQGCIKAQFDFGTREGIQRKRFEVFTSDGRKETLYLTVDIPRTYQISPRRLSWNANDPNPKSCRLINASATPIRITSVESSGSSFNGELKEIRVGFEYEVLVTPVQFSGVGRTIISISTESVNGQKPRIYKIYAAIR